ncbi:MAG TPA: fumarylacetoacetate hydrolase family protein [Acetobacteraceae bacterium]|nr:fumarylacetoacetate hydrolase family protein [Acetobacteraceae bacterium]
MRVEVARVSVKVLGGGDFPVRRIWCVGQNYRAHALEMGGDPDRAPPFFFQKPADAIVVDGGSVPYPPMTAALEHEIELVVAMGAADRIFGYAVGVDLTRRDLQAAARKAGRPWDMAKGFDHSAPCGAITPADVAGAMSAGAIWLQVNGVTRQSSDISQRIWNTADMIAELSRYVALFPGDLIFTGTPENVGKLERGDRLLGHIDGLSDLRVSIS